MQYKTTTIEISTPMKTTCLILILLLLSVVKLHAQCIDQERDTVYIIHCGDSVKLVPGLSATHTGYLTTHALNQVVFTDPLTGIVAGDHGSILRTTDGGMNWSVGEYLPAQDWISLSFVSPQTGVIASTNGVIARTSDGGISWEVVYDDPSRHFTKIRCVNANNYMAIGEQGLILKSTDGGNNWNVIPSGTTSFLNDILFVNNTLGYIAGDNDFTLLSNIFLKSSDGGGSWMNAPLSTDYCDYYTLAFANETTGYVTGSNFTYRTTDGGIHWNALSWNTYGGIALENDSTGYSVDISGIRKFYHYGDTYEDIDFYIPADINDLVCPAEGSVYAVCDYGYMYSNFEAVSYQWEPSEGLTADDVESPGLKPDEPARYTVTVEFSNGEVCKDTLQVLFATNMWYYPSLCMVTVDPVSPHFRILWNQPELTLADSVILYKDGNIAGQPIRLAGFSAASAGEYLDEQSNPLVKTEWYSIHVIDQCKSSYTGSGHNPVHLAINQGIGNSWNLIWNRYFGAPVITYNIYRGTSSNNLQLLTSVSSGITQYTDLNAPTGDITYQIEAILDVDCSISPNAGPSLSNVAKYSPIGKQEERAVSTITISNNPVDEQFTLKGKNPDQIEAIQLLTLHGETLFTWWHPVTSTFDIPGLSAGMYLVKINLKDTPQRVMLKLIKR
jgi:photosystem II stability/assembly factor-like uncharacterized protein